MEMIPVELIGGPADGAVIGVPAIMAKLAIPRGEKNQKAMTMEEAQFNVSYHGSPMAAGVLYDVYIITEKVTEHVVAGEIIQVTCYEYDGVRDGVDGAD